MSARRIDVYYHIVPLEYVARLAKMEDNLFTNPMEL